MRASWARSGFVISLILCGFMRCEVPLGSEGRLVGVTGVVGVIGVGGAWERCTCCECCVRVDGSDDLLVWLGTVNSTSNPSILLLTGLGGPW